MIDSLITDMDKGLGIASFKDGDVESGIKYFENYISSLQDRIEQNSDNEKYTIEKNLTIEIYKIHLLSAAQKAYSDKKWILCAKCCQILLKYNTNDNAVYKHAGLCFRNLEQFETALELMEIYAKKEPDDPMVPIYLAEGYYSVDPDKYAFKAVDYYKKFLEKHPCDAQVYNTIGSIYASSINVRAAKVDEQLYYFNKALEYSPNDKYILRNLHLTYLRQGNFKKATDIYEKIYKLHKKTFNHDNYYDYAAFLISIGNFQRGWSFLDHRFEKETSPTFYPQIDAKKWNGENNIQKNTLLVHCEQGFGDVIMYIRFVEYMKKYAKNVITVVQDELVDLFRESRLGFPVYPRSTDLKTLEFDYHIPLVSLPRVVKITANTVPKKEGYLNINPLRVEAFKKEFLKTSKFKIGVCFEGAASGKTEQRDIDWKYVRTLSDIENVQLYCLKKDLSEENFKAIDENINIICLGDKLRSFADTAAAMKGMDLIISTDNVILNLAGALGLQTLGLYNFQREYRWYGVEEGKMVWYDSVKPLQAKAQNEWEELIIRVSEEVKKRINT